MCREKKAQMEVSVHHLVLKVTPLNWALCCAGRVGSGRCLNSLLKLIRTGVGGGRRPPRVIISRRYLVAVCKFVFGRVVMAPL